MTDQLARLDLEHALTKHITAHAKTRGLLGRNRQQADRQFLKLALEAADLYARCLVIGAAREHGQVEASLRYQLTEAREKLAELEAAAAKPATSAATPAPRRRTARATGDGKPSPAKARTEPWPPSAPPSAGTAPTATPAPPTTPAPNTAKSPTNTHKPASSGQGQPPHTPAYP